ncbi:ubiquitin-conjugating enzyme E2 D/E [Sporothrix schenckii 1099-18]|uniref:E2 ubiquitin-conjugating enzyme n=2 Tax=Sporothrix schenckii TaxID=29908 RepID=U7Q242_SPOS1|nr:ubiquitin-conjugating enzyme E2 D/E [Sporothrix schenckii 1099-18]ERT01075.1 hypothetical protein HMPREF1624_02312 [Sporothrix schenckii ATCC 58251]KJR88208.1 ubiquitin-conjugating enzyme E2 D/E [Sporothrix schenckii 1099-18]
MSFKRIAKDFANCQANAPDGMTIEMPYPDDMSIWHITLQGPPDTVYAKGTYGLVVVLPSSYPFKPPVVTFATRIYHPNVTNDSAGNICLAILKTDNWKPAFPMTSVLEAVRNLLVEPQPDDPLEARIADEYRTQRAAFEEQARLYVEKYAKGAPTFPPRPDADGKA